MLECLSRLHPSDTSVTPKRCQWIKYISRFIDTKLVQAATDLLDLPSICKPLKGPLNDRPLVVCDASRVDRKRDFTAADLLYPELLTENYQVHHNDNFLWYYLSGQRTDEMMVFMQVDSKNCSMSGRLDLTNSDAE